MYSKAHSTNNLLSCNCDNNNKCTLLVMNKAVAMEIKKGKNGVCKTSNGLKKPKTIAGDGWMVKSTPCQQREVRKEEVLAIRNRFPTKIPVIVQRFYKETHLPHLDKAKFLVPQEITMSQFQTILRNRMHMNSNQALYLLVNNRSMLSLSLTLSEVYTEHAGADGFLYVTYASQEVFGSNNLSNNYKDLRNRVGTTRICDI